jgi:DNA polymerase III subunit delta'
VSEPLQLLPWQAPLWQHLAQAIAQERLGHALLLSGLRGTGKRAFARVLAAALWCESPGPERLPCGRCNNCRQVASEAHPSLSILRPEEDKKIIAIDAVRALCERLVMTSHDGRAKVAIIDPADGLNVNGINALLKTIEEPPPRSHLLLVSERPLALAPTLRSRCQQLRFAIPAREGALQWLQQAAPEADTAAALDAAQGAPLRALQLIEDKSLELQQAWRGALLELAAGRSEPLQAVAAVGGEKQKDAGPFLQWLYGWLLVLLRTGLAPPRPGDALGALASKLPQQALDRYIGDVQDSLRRLDQNANAQLLLEAVLVRWRGLVALGQRT